MLSFSLRLTAWHFSNIKRKRGVRGEERRRGKGRREERWEKRRKRREKTKRRKKKRERRRREGGMDRAKEQELSEKCHLEMMRRESVQRNGIKWTKKNADKKLYQKNRVGEKIGSLDQIIPTCSSLYHLVTQTDLVWLFCYSQVVELASVFYLSPPLLFLSPCLPPPFLPFLWYWVLNPGSLHGATSSNFFSLNCLDWAQLHNSSALAPRVLVLHACAPCLDVYFL